MRDQKDIQRKDFFESYLSSGYICFLEIHTNIIIIVQKLIAIDILNIMTILMIFLTKIFPENITQYI